MERTSTGFSAVPSGCRWSPGDFELIGGGCVFWSKNGDGVYAWCRILNHNYANTFRSDNPVGFGYSVRCIQN